MNSPLLTLLQYLLEFASFISMVFVVQKKNIKNTVTILAKNIQRQSTVFQRPLFVVYLFFFSERLFSTPCEKQNVPPQAVICARVGTLHLNVNTENGGWRAKWLGRGKGWNAIQPWCFCTKHSHTQTVSVTARAQITPLMSRLDMSDMLDVFVFLSILHNAPPKFDPNLTSKPQQTKKKRDRK